MQKILSILFIAFSFIFISACSDNESTPTSNVIVFTRSECTRTHFAIKFLNELKKTHNITYIIKDLSLAESRRQVSELGYKHGLTGKQVFTPIIFTDNGALTGWDSKSPDELKHLLNIR